MHIENYVSRGKSKNEISFTLESEWKVALTLIMVGIVFFVGIFWVILSFGKVSDRADRDMRIICNEEFSYSNFVGQNLPKLSTEDKNSELSPVSRSSSKLLSRSPLVEP